VDDWQLALSSAHFYLGDALRRKGDHEGTLQHFRSYLEIARHLAGAHPGDPKYEAEVSYGHGNVGAAYEAAGDLRRALSEYQTAVDLDRRRLQRAPRNEKWQTDLAISLNRLGAVLQSSGDLAGARRAFGEQLTLQRQLVAAAPNDAKRMTRLATSLAYTGILQQMMGDAQDALASFNEELVVTTKLMERDPVNVTARRNRASVQSRIAILLRDDLPRAQSLIREAEQTMREVVRLDARPTWRRDLAVIMQRGAAIRLRAGDRSRLRETAQEALAIMENVAVEEPNNPHTARALCEVLLFAADAEPPDSSTAAAYRSRVATLAAMERNDPRLTDFRARALMTLGREGEAAPLIAELRGIGYRDGDLQPMSSGSPPGSPPAQ
jgi:tetratricopeptide (TPR) repeat protein